MNCDSSLGDDATITESPFPITVYDPDGKNNTAFVFNLSSVDPNADYFTVDPKTGVISTSGVIDVDISKVFSYIITILVSDMDGFSNTFPIQVTIEDVNDNDPIPDTNNVYYGTISENEPISTEVSGLSIQFNDADSVENSVLRYSIESNDAFELLSDDKTTIISKKEFNYESDSVLSYELVITAFDNADPVRSGSATITIDILDVNDNRPSINAISDPTPIFKENGAPVTVANINITDADSAQFLLQYGIVSITDAKDANETLSHTDVIPGELVVGLNPSGDKLVIIGEGILEEYEEFLNSIMYHSSADEFSLPLLRTVSFGVSDLPLNNISLEIGSGGPINQFLTDEEVATFLVNIDESEVSYANSNIILETVNDQPILECPQSGFVALPSILEDIDDSLNTGVNVNSFISTIVSDADFDTDSNDIGIAVISTENSGTWQYSIDGGVSFSDLNVSAESATLLGPNSVVRFVPDAEATGSTTITFRAYDFSDGLAIGSTGINTTATFSDSTGPFSLDTCLAVLEVLPVNDRPMINLNIIGPISPNTNVMYEENQTPKIITVVDPDNVDVFDKDHSYLTQLSVNVTKDDGSCELNDYFDAVLDELVPSNTTLKVTELSTYEGGACWNYIYTGNCTHQQWEYFISRLRFMIDIDEPSDHTRRIAYVISDGVASSEPVYAYINVSLVSDHCPEVDLHINGQLTYKEHSDPILVAKNTNVTDNDFRGTNPRATVTITVPDNEIVDEFGITEETKIFDCQSCVLSVESGQTPINSTFENNILTLEGPATSEEFESVLQSLTFHDNGDEPSFVSMAVLTIEIEDDSNLDCTSTDVTIVLDPVNDYAVDLQLGNSSINGTTEYIEDLVVEPKLVDSVRISDPDTVDSSSYSITIEFATGYIPGEDELSITDTSIVQEQTVSKIVLQGSLKNIASALQTITYKNTNSDNPMTHDRIVGFYMSDGLFDSEPAFITIGIESSNDAPIVQLPDGMRSFMILGDPVLIAPNAALSDPDNDNLFSMTLVLGEYDDNQDIQSLTDTFSESLTFDAVSGIDGSYDQQSATITFTGVASIDSYELLLKSVKYSNTNPDPTLNNRAVSITISDGLMTGSGTVRISIFGDAQVVPVVDLNGDLNGVNTAVTFVTKETDTSIRVAPDAIVFDSNGDKICSATIVYAGPDASCSSSFLNFETTFLDVSIDETQSVDTITYSLNTTIACRQTSAFDAIFRGITFKADNDALAGICTLSFSAVDEHDGVSNVAVATVTVTVGNDPPYIDLDLGRTGRHFSFEYTQDLDEVVHIVSIFNESLAMNLTFLVPVGEAPGEADSDITDDMSGVAILTNQSHAGYILTDPDDVELEYLNVKFLYNTASELIYDSIRFPCVSKNLSIEIMKEGCVKNNEVIVYSDLECDPTLFDSCNNPVDLCTNLTVTISCPSKQYKFEYSSGGTVERYETLLGNLGYEYDRNTSIFDSIDRTLNVTASDGKAISLEALVSFVVEPGDDAPVIDPSQTFGLCENEKPNRTHIFYTLEVFNPDDTPADLSTISLTIVDSDVDGVFTIDDLANFRLVGDLDRETKDSYFVSFSAHFVTDDPRVSSTATVTITIIDINDNRPEAESQHYTAEIYENLLGQFVADVDATDADIGSNGRIVYSPLLGIGADKFTVNTSTGVVTNNGTLNLDDAEMYLLVLIIEDMGEIPFQSYTQISINILPAPPDSIVFDISSNVANVLENVDMPTTVGNVSAREVGTNDQTNIRYRIISIDPEEDPVPFNVTDDGEVFVLLALDAERSEEYNVTIEAYSIRTDIDVSPATVDLIITVDDVDEFNSEFFPSGPFNFSVNENAPIGLVLGELGASDDDASEPNFIFEIVQPVEDDFPFTFVNDGNLVLNRTLDFEKQENYTFQISVRNELGMSNLSSIENVLITVININDIRAEFTNTPYIGEVRETASNGTVVINVTFSDEDMKAEDITLLLIETDGPFCLEGYNIVVCDSDELTSIEEEGKEFFVNLQLIDNGFTDNTTATISLILINEFPPDFPSVSDQEIQEQEGNCTIINEFAAKIGDIVVTFVATDSKDGGASGTIQYNLLDGFNLFAVNSTNGELTITDCVDADIQNQYTLTVEAVDGGDVDGKVFTVTQTIVVKITDYNDNPPIITSSFEFTATELETETSTPFGMVTATDADITPINNIIQFAIKVPGIEGDGFGTGCTNNDDQIIGMQQTGELVFCKPVDFETADTTVFVLEARVENLNLAIILLEDGVVVVEAHRYEFEITVYVVGHNEHRPSISGSDFQFSIKENENNETVVDTIPASDSDSPISDGGMLQYYLSLEPTVGVDDDSCTSDLPFYINSAGVISTCAIFDYEDRTEYYFYVSVCDKGSPRLCVVMPENVTISVIDLNDNPPVFADEFVEIVIPENESSSNILYMLSWTDEDSDMNSVVTLVLEPSDTPFGLSDSSLLIVDENAIDYETLPNFYSLTVTADNQPSDPNDTPQMDVITINITITDINDEPPIIIGVTVFFIAENMASGSFVGQVSASDNEEGENGRLTFISLNKETIDSVCHDDVVFALNEANGNITSCTELDRETKNVYPFKVTVCDNGTPSLCDTENYEVNVTDLNDNKPVFPVDPIELLIEENSPADTSLYTIVTSDKDLAENSQVTFDFLNITSPFEIRNDNEIYYTGSSILDFEGLINNFILQLRAVNAPSDPTDTTQIVDIVVIIDITDCNDQPPVFATENFTQISVEEHLAEGVIVFNVSTTDADTLPNTNVSYEVSTGDTIFTMVGASLTVKDSVLLDREEIGDYTIASIQATNPSDACGEEQTSELSLNIMITDINDNIPYFIGSQNFMVREDAFFSSVIGQVIGQDDDFGNNAVLQYSIESSEACSYDNPICISEMEMDGSGSGSGSGDNSCTEILPFDIDPDNGKLQTCYDLDYETFYSYTLNIKACDRGKPKQCNTADYIVMVIDVNDNAPVIRGPFEFDVNETVTDGHIVGCVNATDEDTSLGGMIRYYSDGVIECTSELPFQIHETSGCISVCNELNFEHTMVFTYPLLVSDLGDPSLSSRADISINILNRNDHGPQIVPPFPPFVIENAVNEFVVTVQATDEDISPHNMLTFSLTDNAGGRFNITSDGKVYTQLSLNREAASFHLITVEVTDGVFSDSEVINVTVTDENDEKPVYMGDLEFTISENSIFAISLDFTDNDFGINAEFLLSSNDSRFYFNSSNPLTLQNNVQLDRDPGTGGSPTVSLEIIAKDLGTPEISSDPVVITLVLEDVNDNAPIPQSPFIGSITDGTPANTFVFNVSAIDHDQGENAKFAFQLLDQNDTFYINGTDIYAKKDIVLESNQPININVTVSVFDFGSPSLSTEYVISIFVIDILPIFTPNAYNFFAIENKFSISVGEVIASDRDLVDGNEMFEFSIITTSPYGGFTIVNSTVYSPNNYVDYEDNSKFALTVGVGNGDMIFDEATIAICINDTNEVPPLLSPLNLTATLNENSPVGTILGRVYGIDPEFGINGEVTYSIVSGDSSNIFSLDGDGNLKLEHANGSDFELNKMFELAYQACDSGVPPLCSDPGYIFVVVTDSDDVPPEFDPDSYEINIDELFNADVLIVDVNVSDLDTSNADLVFSLVPEYPQFRVQQVTGDIYTTSTLLDYEAETNYTFLIVATDTAGLNGTATVQISVFDINDNRARVESTVTIFRPQEDSLIPISLSALYVVDEDAISVNMMDKVKVNFYPSTTSNVTYPLSAGFCDHDNSSYISADSFSLCRADSFCDDWQITLTPVGGAIESDGIFYFEEASQIARPLQAPGILLRKEDFASDFTMSFWVSVQSSGQIVQFEKSQDLPLIVHVSSNGYFQILSTVGGVESLLVEAPISLFDDAYHHLVVVREGVNLFLYVDGKLSASSNNADSIFSSFAGFTTVIFGEDLIGSISQSRYCGNYAFSASEVACITSCGEVFGAEGTENVTATVDYYSRSVLFACKLGGSCSLEEMNTALDTLTFLNQADEPNPIDRGLVLVANDTKGFGEKSIFAIRPILVNDKRPVLDFTGNVTDKGINYTLSYVERSGPMFIIPNQAVLFDLDSGYWTFSKATVTLVDPKSEEKLEFGSDLPPEVLSQGDDYTLTIYSADVNELYPEVLLDALKAIQYSSKEKDPSDAVRIIEIVIYDSEDTHTNSPVSTISVVITSFNDPPVISIDNANVLFTEEDGQVVLLADIDVAINDPDNNELSEATLQLLDVVNVDDEYLSLETNNIKLSVEYDSNTRTITISGVASNDEYISALKDVVYHNTNVDPTSEERRVSISVVDSLGAASVSAVYMTIEILLHNSPPVVIFPSTNDTTYTADFIEDQDVCINLFDMVSVSDPENLGIFYFTFEIENYDENVDHRLKVNETLPFGTHLLIDQPGVTRILIFTPNNQQNYDFIASLSTTQVQYCNYEEELSLESIMISLSFTDIWVTVGDVSKTSILNIIVNFTQVNDLPQLSLKPIEGLAFGDQQNQFIDPDSIVFTDNDDSKFSEIKIIITNPRDGAENELIQAAGNIPELGILIGTDVGDDGSFTFTITFPLLADSTAIVDSIKELRYNNLAGQYTADTPRTICIRVNDTKTLSEPQCVNITLSDPNIHSPFIVNGTENSFAFSESTSEIVIGKIVAYDDDEDPIASIIAFSIDSVLSSTSNGIDVVTTDEEIFSIDSMSGELTAPNGVDSESYVFHNITIRVRDNGNPNNFNFTNVLLSVNDINDEYPVFENLPFTFDDQAISDGNPVATDVYDVDAIDNDQTSPNNLIASYNLENNYFTDGKAIFAINETTGIITVPNNQIIDADEHRVFYLNVSATDSGSPPLKSYGILTIIPTERNDNAPEVDQLIPALFPTNNRKPVSIGPAIRVIDKDEVFGLIEVTVELTDAVDVVDDYISCAATCQDQRLEQNGFLEGSQPAIDLLSLASFYNEGISDTTLGASNCSAKQFVRQVLPANDGYGSIPQSEFGSTKFATGEFSFTFIVRVTNEGYIVSLVDNPNPDADAADVNRIFAIRIRRKLFDVIYSYDGNIDQAKRLRISDITDSPFTEYFDTDNYPTRHYAVVVKNGETNPIAEIYSNCELLGTLDLDGLPDSSITNNNVTIARAVPGSFSSESNSGTGAGHLGGDLHGLYYYPYPLTKDQILETCVCERIIPPISYPSSISITEQTLTSITFQSSISSNDSIQLLGNDDTNSFLRSIKYEYTLEVPGSNRELTFHTVGNEVDNSNNVAVTTGEIEFVLEDDDLPYIDLNGLVTQGSDYATVFMEDSNSVPLTDGQVRVGRETNTDIITINNVTIELLNPLDGNSETLIGEGIEFISVTSMNDDQILEVSGPGLSTEFAEVLLGLRYHNTNQNPTTTEPRNISFTIYDTNGRVNSPLSYTLVTIQPTNDAPILSLAIDKLETIDTVVFIENNGSINLTDHTDITDIDDTNLQSAKIEILDNFMAGKDFLTIQSVDGISASYDSSTGVLLLTGDATIEEYEDVLGTLQFESTDNPLLDQEDQMSLLRTVTIIVNDGDVDSNSVMIQVEFMTVNDPTFFNINGSNSSIEYIEGSPPVLIAPNAYILDIDNEYLQSMTVAFEQGGESGDVFNYDGSQSSQFFFTQNTLDNIQSILRSITYSNTEPELPSLNERNIIITIESLDGKEVEQEVSITVKDKNEDPPTFENLPYSFELQENVEIDTSIGMISATDPDISESTIDFTISSSDFVLVVMLDDNNAILQTNKTFDFEIDETTISFTVTASDGELEASSVITVKLLNVNEPPTLTISATSFVAAAQQSRQLITSEITLADPDTSDEIISATFILSGVPSLSDETLTIQQSITGYIFTNESSTVFTLTKLDSAVVSFEDALQSIQYTAGEITDPLIVRTVTIVVKDFGGLESEEIAIDVTLADIPVFSMSIYEVSLIEGMSHPNFLLVEANVANQNDTITYQIEDYPDIVIDNTTGYLSLNAILDHETVESIELSVYAVATVPLPRTATASVLITVLDINDVKPNVTLDEVNVDLGEENSILLNIAVEDPDTSFLDSADITILGSPLQPSVFSGKVCVDEVNAITKMTAVCELSYDFTKLLSNESIGSDASLDSDDYDNNILTLTGGSNSYLQSNANLSDFEGDLDELTAAFWIKPDSDGSGYVIFLSNDDASERYFAVYYQSPDRFVVTLKQANIDGLVGHVKIIFQLSDSIEDNVYHFIMIYYSNRDIQMSVDGVKVNSVAVSYANIYDKLYGKSRLFCKINYYYGH